MRRRALLSGVALGVTSALSGCLGDVRRTVSGEIRTSHARARRHDARDTFVRGGLTADADADEWARAWVFPEAPASGVTVFTDVFGAEEQRRWDNEVHNENYDAGFTLLAQVRTPRDDALELAPALSPDPRWTGLDRALLPVRVQRADLEPDELPDAEAVTTTLLAYFEAAAAPSSARVTVYRDDPERGGGVGGPDDAAGPLTTVEAGRWTPP